MTAPAHLMDHMIPLDVTPALENVAGSGGRERGPRRLIQHVERALVARAGGELEALGFASDTMCEPRPGSGERAHPALAQLEPRPAGMWLALLNRRAARSWAAAFKATLFAKG